MMKMKKWKEIVIVKLKLYLLLETKTRIDLISYSFRQCYLYMRLWVTNPQTSGQKKQKCVSFTLGHNARCSFCSEDSLYFCEGLQPGYCWKVWGFHSELRKSKHFPSIGGYTLGPLMQRPMASLLAKALWSRFSPFWRPYVLLLFILSFVDYIVQCV